MNKVYEITAQNDVDRQGGQRDAVLSRAMLAQVAARIRATRGGGGGGMGGDGGAVGRGGGGAGEGPVRLVVMGPDGPMEVDADQCAVM